MTQPSAPSLVCVQNTSPARRRRAREHRRVLLLRLLLYVGELLLLDDRQLLVARVLGLDRFALLVLLREHPVPRRA